MRANYRMQRLFIDAPLAAGGTVTPDKAQSNYLLNVLRLTEGAELLVFNGRDGEWRALLRQPGKKQAALELAEQVRPQPAPSDLVYCFAPLKSGRLDYMVQKAVEMGAGVLQPVMTHHTQVPKINVERMAANAAEAAEQCGILSIPESREPLKFDRLLAGWDPERRLIFCDEDAETNNPLAILQSLAERPARRVDRPGRRLLRRRAGPAARPALRHRHSARPPHPARRHRGRRGARGHPGDGRRLGLIQFG
jgi:16S rRNA (uracil1498-N3)-methyltransferase